MGPIDYTAAFGQQGGPFGSVMGGLQAGAQFAQIEQQRMMQAQQMQAQQAQMQQEQAKQTRLAELRSKDPTQLSAAEWMELAEMSASPESRKMAAERVSAMPQEERAVKAREYGQLASAVLTNPEIGIRMLTEREAAETDPRQKQAWQVMRELARTDPRAAGMFALSQMSLAGEEFRQTADSIMKNLGVDAESQRKAAEATRAAEKHQRDIQEADIKLQRLDRLQEAELRKATSDAQRAQVEARFAAARQQAELDRSAAQTALAQSQALQGSAPTVTQIQDPTNPERMITIDARRYQGGSIGDVGVIGASGRTAPAEAASMKRQEGLSQFQTIVDSLRTAYDDLDRMRSIPSEQRSVVSNALSFVASTGPGQLLGRAGGTRQQTQRDIIQGARNQLLNAVKNATGMSAQQLNSNVEFRSWIESLTDPTKSYQANVNILDNLERFIGDKTASPRAFPTPPPEAINALRSGAGTDAQFDELFGPGAAARARRQ